MTPRFLACCVSVALGFLFVSPRSEAPLCGDEPARPAAALEAGFGEADITPEVDKKPVYIAGFGKNRKADGVHDPLMARAIVLAHEKVKIAIVSVDLVGLFH